MKLYKLIVFIGLMFIGGADLYALDSSQPNPNEKSESKIYSKWVEDNFLKDVFTIDSMAERYTSFNARVAFSEDNDIWLRTLLVVEACCASLHNLYPDTTYPKGGEFYVINNDGFGKRHYIRCPDSGRWVNVIETERENQIIESLSFYIPDIPSPQEVLKDGKIPLYVTNTSMGIYGGGAFETSYSVKIKAFVPISKEGLNDDSPIDEIWYNIYFYEDIEHTHNREIPRPSSGDENWSIFYPLSLVGYDIHIIQTTLGEIQSIQ